MQLPKQPELNHHALNWFVTEYENGTLDLSPSYQRNPIWSTAQKCYLIDSILGGSPIPPIYLNLLPTGEDGFTRTNFEVIDGQQRLTSIIQFIRGDWPLKRLDRMRYPVTDYYDEFEGLRFFELPSYAKQHIWDYRLIIQEIRNYDRSQVRGLFQRLNFVNERLNAQELRRARFDGAFIKAAEKFASSDFFEEIGLFTRTDVSRMRDVEFVSQLLILCQKGIQAGDRKTLDEYYALYDDGFLQKTKITKKYLKIVSCLRTIAKTIEQTRFKKKSDFYGLFALLATRKRLIENWEEFGGMIETNLLRVDKALQNAPKEIPADFALYYSTTAEGPNKKAKRENRVKELAFIVGIEARGQ